MNERITTLLPQVTEETHFIIMSIRPGLHWVVPLGRVNRYMYRKVTDIDHTVALVVVIAASYLHLHS